MKPLMMRSIGNQTDSASNPWIDEDTEVERLPTAVRTGCTAGSQQGQTLVTFVENESTDDE